MANFVFPVVAFALFTLIAGWVWRLMAGQPERWAAWVARDNQFWVKQGLVSERFAARMRRWETSSVLRKLMAATALLSAIGFIWTSIYLARALMIEHQKVRMPFNPALQVRPNTTPPAQKPKLPKR